jgi:hypothetical protein
VIQEFLNVALDKFAGRMTSDETLAYLDRILQAAARYFSPRICQPDE